MPVIKIPEAKMFTVKLSITQGILPQSITQKVHLQITSGTVKSMILTKRYGEKLGRSVQLSKFPFFI